MKKTPGQGPIRHSSQGRPQSQIAPERINLTKVRNPRDQSGSLGTRTDRQGGKTSRRIPQPHNRLKKEKQMLARVKKPSSDIKPISILGIERHVEPTDRGARSLIVVLRPEGEERKEERPPAGGKGNRSCRRAVDENGGVSTKTPYVR